MATLFKNLHRYKTCGSFVLKPGDDLAKQCNASKEKSGVYLVYSISKGKRELVYIGSSGKLLSNGKIKDRQGGGLWDRIVNGKQFKGRRHKSWPKKMTDDKVDSLIIAWYVTTDTQIIHIPSYVEGVLIQKHFAHHERLPHWNKSF